MAAKSPLVTPDRLPPFTRSGESAGRPGTAMLVPIVQSSGIASTIATPSTPGRVRARDGSSANNASTRGRGSWRVERSIETTTEWFASRPSGTAWTFCRLRTKRVAPTSGMTENIDCVATRAEMVRVRCTPPVCRPA